MEMIMDALIFRAVVVATCLTVLPMASYAQSRPPAPVQSQLDKLSAALRKADSTIARLETRVAKLERDAEKDDKDMREEAEKAEEAKEKADIERRLSALERSPAVKGGDAGAVSRTVRAPFVIEDTDGKPIFRVTGGKSPRLTVGIENGGSVELGTGSAGGGIVRVRDATYKDRIILIGSEGFGQLRALSESHSAVLSSNDEKFGATLGLFVGDVPTARIRSGIEGYASLLLTDPAGNERVQAGSIPGSTCFPGSIRTGPRRRPGGLGIPSSIVGAC